MSEGISLGWNCYSTSYAVDNGIRKLKANGYKTCVLTYPNHSLDALENALRQRYPNLKYKIIRLDVQNQQHYEDHFNLMYF